MGLLDKMSRRYEEKEVDVNKDNLAKQTSDKATQVIKELSGKKYTQGKKLIDNVICFTNAGGGCGASTIASNVAFMAQKEGISTILVDLNIMCPIQHTYLGIEHTLNKPDLVSYLNGENDINKSIDSSKSINLLYANNRTLNDDLTCDERIPVENFKQMINHLRNFYDLVIIDCPMRIDKLLLNTALYCCDSIYMVWDEGINSIANTEKLRRNMALSGIDSYTKMRLIINKRTNVSISDYAIQKMNLELIGVIPFSTDVIDNSLRGRIFCDKGVATNKNATEFSQEIASITEKILRIGGYTF